MGCGQSKIHLYPRKSKNKTNVKKGGQNDDADADEDEGHQRDSLEKDIERVKDSIIEENTFPNEKDIGDEGVNGEISVSLLRAKNLSLLQSQEISNSQQNFFRMLDQKIDEGPDYDSASETEIALEEARLNALVQHWESASLTASLCSSASRSLQTTPVRQVQIRLRSGPNSLSKQTGNNDIHINSHKIIANQQIIQQSQQILATSIGGSPQIGKIVKGNSSPKFNEQRNFPNQPIAHPSFIVPQQIILARQRAPTTVSPHVPISFYPPASSQQTYYGQTMHSIPMQVPQNPPEYRFPPAISVQRLAPQVQRQIRETQELIKDTCPPQLYTPGFGSPGPPVRATPSRGNRRSNLETQYSQELS